MNRSAACTGNTFGKGDEAVITACAEEYDPHSHSSVFGYRNALNFKCNFFLRTITVRTAGRQKFLLLIFEANSRDPNSATFQRLSTTIGRFFASSTTQRFARQREKYRQCL